MKTVAIVQARMSSTRLPGKVLKPLLGKLVLDHVLDRLRMCKLVDQIIIATTTDEVDDQLVTWCKKNNVVCFRGDRNDVLSRYYECASKFNAEEIVRITSDNPLIDPEIIDEVITLRRKFDADYAANNIEKSFPHGLDVEVIKYQALAECNKNALKDFEREHVTQYVRYRPKQFKLVNLPSGGDWHNIRLTLDEDEDRQLIEVVMRLLGNDLRFKDLTELFSELPSLAKVNTDAKASHANYNQNEKII